MTSCTVSTISQVAPPPRPLAQAKADFQRTVEEIFAYIPRDTMAEDMGPTPELSQLFTCGGIKSYSWTGGHNAVLKPGIDGAQIIDRIAADWAHKPGWRMKDKRSEKDYPLIILYAADGRDVWVSYFVANRAMGINGGSACFFLDHYDATLDY